MKQAVSVFLPFIGTRRLQQIVLSLFVSGCTLLLPPPFALAETKTITAKKSGSTIDQVGKVLPQVYRLMVDVDGAIKGGTAFLVSGQRVVATNNHVVDGGRAFWLGYLDAGGEARRMPLHLVATYPQKDLALLEALDDLSGRPLRLATRIPAPASKLYAIGFPPAADLHGSPEPGDGNDESYFRPSVLVGYVSRVLRNRWLTSRLQHQTPIIPGYSGGPLVNENGAVVGISTSIHKEANGISYAVLAADLAELTAACALPAAGDRLSQPPPPSHETRAPPATPERMNTHALQERRPLTRDEARLLNKAEVALENGAIGHARLICEDLANATRNPEAYVCLGRAYDPAILKKVGVVGVTGIAELAAFYYGQAGRIRKHTPSPGKPHAGDTPDRPLALADGRGCEASRCRLIHGTGGPVVSCERGRRH